MNTLSYGDAGDAPTLLLVRRRHEPAQVRETLRVAPFEVPVIVDKHALARIVASLRQVPPDPCPAVPRLEDLVRDDRRERAKRRRSLVSIAVAVFTLSALSTVGVLRTGLTFESARHAVVTHLAR